MAATEELRILLRTIADTSGLTKTEQGLKGVETTGQSGAASLLKFGAAAGIATVATDKFVSLLGDSLQVTRDHERITRATTASYGQQTAQWTRFAQQLSATTGLTSDAILEAALSARTLSSNYGLSIEQTQKLISVSADLARIRGIGVAEAFERVQSAIRGEAEASEYLGLTLNATFMAQHAANGAYKETYNSLTDVQRAQLIYNELLKQTATFQGLAASSADSLDGATPRASTAMHNLQIEIGKIIEPATIQGLKLVADTMNLIAGGGVIGRQIPQETGDLIRGWFQNLPGHTFGEAADLAQRDREMARQTDLMRLQDQREQASRAIGTGTGGTVPGVDPAFVGGPYGRAQAAFAQSAARIAFLDQAKAAVRDITSAQDAQVDLQRQSVDLAAQEASIRLSMLPAQQQMAELQRTVTEQQIRARQAALPATEALDDLHYEQERARLIAGNRNATAEERSSARRLLRESARAEPGLALAALEAGRGVTLAGRAVERVGLGEQLFQLTQERALAQITLAQQTNSLLASIAEQRTQAILLTVNVTGEGFSQEVYKELIEAADQATQPTITQLSGVRR